MDYINPEVVAVAAYNVCQKMQTGGTARVPDWTDVALLIGTAAVESGFTMSAKGRGIGPFGLDASVAIDHYRQFDHYDSGFWTFRTFLKQNRLRRASWRIFSEAWLDISGVPFISLESNVRRMICHDVRFACAMCQWTYLNVLQEKGENLQGLARSWSVVYRGDASCEDEFLDAWRQHECELLMHVVGYN